MEDTEARVEVTYAGEHGELPDPVYFESSEADLKSWVSEAIAHGSIPGIPSDPNVDLTDFVVDRFAAKEDRPVNLIMLRPKTPFGG